VQEIPQTLGVDSPFGRKLKQDRPELLAQVRGTRQQIIHGVLRVLQFLVVGNEAAGFYREDKVLRGGIVPAFESVDSRQAIEAIV
jgi:hypothetical protein